MWFKVKGCCCMSLRTAGLVHGWASIVCASILYWPRIFLTDYINSLNTEQPESSDYSKSMYTVKSKKIFKRKHAALFQYIVMCLVAVMLIQGIRKNKYNWLLPWLILSCIAIAVYIAGTLYLACFRLTRDDEAIFYLVVSILTTCLLGWSTSVIYSLYEEIRDTVNRPMTLPYPVTAQSLNSQPLYQVPGHMQLLPTQTQAIVSPNSKPISQVPGHMQLLPTDTQQPIVSPNSQPFSQVHYKD